jgi:hypothetical protein
MNGKERQLPRTMVGRHEYVVDMRNSELRSVNDPSIALEFFKMDFTDGRLSFWYDHANKSMVGKPEGETPGDIQQVSFLIQSLDPEFSRQAQDAIKEVQQLINSGESVYYQNNIHAPSPINGSQPRLLPMINLYGTEFFLDLRLVELRQVDNPVNTIPLNHLNPDKFHFTLLYDTTAMNAFTGTLDEARQRNDIKSLVLPPLDLMISEGIKRHEEFLKTQSEKDKIDRECDLVDSMWDDIVSKGDDEFYEAVRHSKADAKGKAPMEEDQNETSRKRRKGKGI